MTLEQAQKLLLDQQGRIKAWALRWGTYRGIASELGVGLPDSGATGTHLLWLIPVVFIDESMPEGVIV